MRLESLLFAALLVPLVASAQMATKINTGTGWSDSPFVSRDGKRVYFMYSRWNFAPFISSGGTKQPILSGPDRPGLNHSTNPWSESDIYLSTKQNDGTWSSPVNLGLNGAYGDSSGMEISSGSTFVWLRGDGTTNKIVIASKKQNGTWGTPVDVGADINKQGSLADGTRIIQDNPRLSADGKNLYFTSNRPGGMGGKDIWISTKAANGTWSIPFNAGPSINTVGNEDQVWVSPISNTVYLNTSAALERCTWDQALGCINYTAVTFANYPYIGGASVTDDGNTMVFASVDPVTFMISIMIASKGTDGNWTNPRPID